MVGLTLGYGVYVCHGHGTVRLLSHEFRHVYQYEQAGSIAAFLPVYLQQIVTFGYNNAPMARGAGIQGSPGPRLTGEWFDPSHPSEPGAL